MDGMARRIAARWLEAKRVTPSVIGKDHLLVEQSMGSSRRFYVVQPVVWNGEPHMGIKARLFLSYNPKCDAYEVIIASAEGGYGPLVYDAAMEAVYPKWISPDRTSVSPDAARVWKHYLDRRSDVEHEENPEGCPDYDARSWLDYIYRKKPGRLGKSVLTPAELGKHPMVVRHMGEPQSYRNVGTEMLDYTPSV